LLGQHGTISQFAKVQKLPSYKHNPKLIEVEMYGLLPSYNDCIISHTTKVKR